MPQITKPSLDQPPPSLHQVSWRAAREPTLNLRPLACPQSSIIPDGARRNSRQQDLYLAFKLKVCRLVVTSISTEGDSPLAQMEDALDRRDHLFHVVSNIDETHSRHMTK